MNQCGLEPEGARICTRALRYLMEQESIWYDRVPDAHGNMVHGPRYQAVALLARCASDIRWEARAA